MLRYVRLNLLQQTIVEFCCSRVVFSNLSIPLLNINLLFDQDFILNKIKKYKRSGEEATTIVKAVCGKCEGYGFLDWVTKIRTEDGVDEDDWYKPDTKIPVIVKNENPIETIFVDARDNQIIYIYYISYIDKDDPLIYRCDQCQGTGLVHDTSRFSKCTPEYLNIIQPSPLKRKTKQTLTLLQKFIRYLKRFI